MNALLSRRCWIFDMDGTLTVPIHDFDAIRRQLDLPAGEPILEAIARLPATAASELHHRLAMIERELALRAQVQEDALALVDVLSADPARLLGVVTRNSHALAGLTLEAVSLDRAFPDESRVGRDEALPKPNPDGIALLLERWGAQPSEAVMVGDYLFDLQAGRAAGVATVHIDRSGARWPGEADVVVTDLRDLLR